MSSLRCQLCRKDVPQGFACCPYCNVGYAAPLACTSCGAVLQAGSTSCFRCDRPPAPVPQQLVPAAPAAQVQFPSALAPASGSVVVAYPLPRPVEETYLAGRHGVDSVVSIPAGDVEVMNLMCQGATLLRMLADKMNQFRGHMALTRENIKSCRRLADDLQEEVEVRRGPRG